MAARNALAVTKTTVAGLPSTANEWRRNIPPTPLSGGDRKALNKELTKARGVTLMLARQSDELRAKGEALIREADKLSCESWNERMWADGEPIDPMRKITSKSAETTLSRTALRA
jgi:hypothetical protein